MRRPWLIVTLAVIGVAFGATAADVWRWLSAFPDGGEAGFGYPEFQLALVSALLIGMTACAAWMLRKLWNSPRSGAKKGSQNRASSHEGF